MIIPMPRKGSIAPIPGRWRHRLSLAEIVVGSLLSEGIPRAKNEKG
jgi:hypothetical protein